MKFVATCPCGASFEVGRDDSGSSVECPSCHRALEIPELPPDPRHAPPVPAAAHVHVPAHRHIVVHAHKTAAVPPEDAARPKPGRRRAHSPALAIVVGLLVFAGIVAFAALRLRGRVGHAPKPSREEVAELLPGAVPLREAARLERERRAAAPAAAPAAAAAPAGPRAPGSGWDLASRAQVDAGVFGAVSADGANGARLTDLLALPDGRLVACGVAAAEVQLPGAAAAHRLGGAGPAAKDTGFLVEFSPDGRRALWTATFPAAAFLPARLAPAPGGGLYVGGASTDRAAVEAMAECLNKGYGLARNCRALVARVAADGARLEWLRYAGPNLSELTGLAADGDGRVLLTGSAAGRGEPLLVVRLAPDGKPAEFAQAKGGPLDGAVALAKDEPQLAAYFAPYAKGDGAPHDYDGPGGSGPVHLRMYGPRYGGQVLALPGGDFAVSAAVLYDLSVPGQRAEPTCDLLVARYGPGGRLKWATNLYRAGDGLQTPDQRPVDLAFDGGSDSLLVLASQQGSGHARLAGDLPGDPGTRAVSWVGRVEAASGKLLDGWYFANAADGQYDEKGRPKATAPPALSGNALARVRADGRGRVWLAGAAGPQTFTTPGAEQAWEPKQAGQQPCVVALSADLKEIVYASVLRGNGAEAGGRFAGFVLAREGPMLAGWVSGSEFVRGTRPEWSDETSSREAACLVRLAW